MPHLRSASRTHFLPVLPTDISAPPEPSCHCLKLSSDAFQPAPCSLLTIWSASENTAPSIPCPHSSRDPVTTSACEVAGPGVMSTALPSWKDRQRAKFSTAHIQLPWRSIQLLVPHRWRRKLRSKLRNRQSPASSITALQTSFSLTDTIRALQSHHWSLYDGQYLLLAFLGIFSLCVIQSPGPLVKTAVATLLLASLVFPITRQFFLPFLPIAAWLIFFYAASYVFQVSLHLFPRFHEGFWPPSAKNCATPTTLRRILRLRWLTGISDLFQASIDHRSGFGCFLPWRISSMART